MPKKGGKNKSTSSAPEVLNFTIDEPETVKKETSNAKPKKAQQTKKQDSEVPDNKASEENGGYYLLVGTLLVRVGPPETISNANTSERQEDDILEAIQNVKKDYFSGILNITQAQIQDVRAGSKKALLELFKVMRYTYINTNISIKELCALGGWPQSAQAFEKIPDYRLHNPFGETYRYRFAAPGGHLNMLALDPSPTQQFMPFGDILEIADRFGQVKYKHAFLRKMKEWKVTHPQMVNGNFYADTQSFEFPNFNIPSLVRICSAVVAAEALRKNSVSQLAKLPAKLFELVCQEISRDAHRGYHTLMQLQKEVPQMASLIPISAIVDAIERSEELTRIYTHNKFPFGDVDVQQPLIDVFAEISTFVMAPPTEFEENVTKFLPQPREPGTPSIVSKDKFLNQFQQFTRNYFAGFDFSNVVVIGGSVLASLLPVPVDKTESKKKGYTTEYFTSTSPFKESDIDLCIYGNETDFQAKLVYIYKHTQKVTGKEVQIIASDRQIVFCAHFPFRHIQIVLTRFRHISHILTGADIDCTALAFDGKKLWATPRARMALNHRWTIASENLYPIRGSPFYETRLYKYAQRGFTIIDRGYQNYIETDLAKKDEWPQDPIEYEQGDAYWGAALVAGMARWPHIATIVCNIAKKSGLPYGPSIGQAEVNEYMDTMAEETDYGYGPSSSCLQQIRPQKLQHLRLQDEAEMQVNAWYGPLFLHRINNNEDK